MQKEVSSSSKSD